MASRSATVAISQPGSKTLYSDATGGRRLEAPPAREAKGRRRLMGAGLASFIACVIAPTIVGLVYLLFFASNEYVSEARFVIRGGADELESQNAETGTAIVALSQGNASGAVSKAQQDSYIVTNYISSRTIIDAIGGVGELVALYSKPDLGWPSRLSADASFETAWRYWRNKVVAVLDIPSGMIILQVRAFTPSDAKRLAQQIAVASENLVNDMSERARADALKRAREELSKARDRVDSAQKDLLYFRNTEHLLDPMMIANSTADLLAGLYRQKFALENSIALNAGSVSTASPVQQVPVAQLKTVNGQIDALRATLTSQTSDGVISDKLARYDKLQLDLNFAERLYQVAADSLERAQRQVERQHLYLMTVVPPTEAERARYPWPFVDTLLIFFWTTVGWSIVTLMIAGVRDHA